VGLAQIKTSKEHQQMLRELLLPENERGTKDKE